MGNNGKCTPLVLCGPKGLGFVAGALCIIAPVLPFPVHVIEFDDRNNTHEAGDLCIATLPLDHGMPCLGYRVTLKRKPVFNPQKAEALCVPLPLYKVLHEGTEITLDDGRRITPKMVTDGPRTPISVCYITDTRSFDGIAAFCHDADLLVCEGTHADESLRGKTHERGHMLFSESAAIAAEAGVKQLWLTHFSPALSDAGQEIDKAKAAFPNAVAGFDGLRITL
jgi:ribonuclease Z